MIVKEEKGFISSSLKEEEEKELRFYRNEDNCRLREHPKNIAFTYHFLLFYATIILVMKISVHLMLETTDCNTPCADISLCR